jgi:bifunctional oligoribonuclease and PAP phosphatase NrnA
MASNSSYQQVIKLLNQGQSFCIGTHINPDGDGIGSMLALGSVLKKLGKDVVLFSNDLVPQSLSFLPGVDKVVSQIPDQQFDAMIMVDCAEPRRAGKDFENKSESVQLIVIDHHLFNELKNAVLCLDTDAASAGEVVFRLIQKIGAEITKEIALCVYTTLAVDTGFFRYSNTTSKVLALAAKLVELGADTWLVAQNLEESFSRQRMVLLGRSLNSLEISDDGLFASMDVTRQMLNETGAALIDSDEFAVFPRSIRGVEVAALFREIADGNVKVSLRSKTYLNVAEIARKQGGGGHVHAAGFTIKSDFNTAKKLVKEEVERELAVKR